MKKILLLDFASLSSPQYGHGYGNGFWTWSRRDPTYQKWIAHYGGICVCIQGGGEMHVCVQARDNTFARITLKGLSLLDVTKVRNIIILATSCSPVVRTCSITRLQPYLSCLSASTHSVA